MQALEKIKHDVLTKSKQLTCTAVMHCYWPLPELQRPLRFFKDDPIASVDDMHRSIQIDLDQPAYQLRSADTRKRLVMRDVWVHDIELVDEEIAEYTAWVNKPLGALPVVVGLCRPINLQALCTLICKHSAHKRWSRGAAAAAAGRNLQTESDLARGGARPCCHQRSLHGVRRRRR